VEATGGVGGDMYSVPVVFSKIATIPTPSMSESFGRVVRSACSHVRVAPLGSW
jgi:hypothetical protein